MTGPVERLNEFRGTRPARALATSILLALAVYNLGFESGPVALGAGAVFGLVGVLGLYNLLVGESVVDTVASRI